MLLPSAPFSLLQSVGAYAYGWVMDSLWYDRRQGRSGVEPTTEENSSGIQGEHHAHTHRPHTHPPHPPPRQSVCTPAPGDSTRLAASHSSDAPKSDRLPLVRTSWQGIIASTNLCVDNFTVASLHAFQSTDIKRAAELLFFLTHVHADHTSGLTPSWNIGHIYTSRVSKALLHAKFGLVDDLVIGLPLHRPQRMALNRCGSEHMWVTLIDASTHCPGATMILFEGYFGRILYTGDIRFDRRCEANLRWFATQYEELKAKQEKTGSILRSKYAHASSSPSSSSSIANGRHGDSGLSWLLDDSHQSTPASDQPGSSSDEADIFPDPSISIDMDVDVDVPRSVGLFGRLDALYLDNTFCHPRYAHFHTTSTVLPAIESIVAAHPMCDILLGGDTLGKEDLLVLLSHLLESKIVVPETRWKLLVAMAREGVALNTEVDERQIERITRHGALRDSTAAGHPSSANAFGASANSNLVPPVSSAPLEPFRSPLIDPRAWLASFSPNPHDGFLKLGPKKQVTTANIDWMNRMVRTAERRAQKAERHLTKRHKPADQQQAQVAVPLPMESTSAAGVVQPFDAPDSDGDVDSSSSGASSSSSDSDDVDPADALTRPVVGIVVSGWAVDRVSHSLAAAGACASSSSPDLTRIDHAAARCQGPGPGNCRIHCLPYSSHSSYTELRRFVSLIRPDVIRPLCKGDCNTSVLDDLLAQHTNIRHIVIPDEMTRGTLNTNKNNEDRQQQSRAYQQRMERHTQALAASVERSSTSFAALANSILAASRSGAKLPAIARSKVAIPIGHDAADDDDDVVIGVGPVAANPSSHASTSRITLDSDDDIELTNTSIPSSLPSLEDQFGVKHDPQPHRHRRRSAASAHPVGVSDPDCTVVSSRLNSASLPRVRSWLDLFAVFEHYPHVPIDGIIVPPPSEEHMRSYAYTNAQPAPTPPTRLASCGVSRRKLPRFITSPDSSHSFVDLADVRLSDRVMDLIESEATRVTVKPAIRLPQPATRQQHAHSTESTPTINLVDRKPSNSNATSAGVHTHQDRPKQTTRDSHCGASHDARVDVSAPAGAASLPVAERAPLVLVGAASCDVSSSSSSRPSASAPGVGSSSSRQSASLKRKRPSRPYASTSLPSYMMQADTNTESKPTPRIITNETGTSKPVPTNQLNHASAKHNHRQAHDLTANEARVNKFGATPAPRSRHRTMIHIDCSQAIELLSSQEIQVK